MGNGRAGGKDGVKKTQNQIRLAHFGNQHKIQSSVMDSSQQTFVGVGEGGGSACQKGYFVCLSVCVSLCLCLCVYMCVRASSCAAFKNAKNENFDLWVTVAKPKYALLIYNALKSNTLSPHASSAMRRWQRQEGGGESWVTTLSPCLAVFVSSCVCVWVSVDLVWYRLVLLLLFLAVVLVVVALACLLGAVASASANRQTCVKRRVSALWLICATTQNTR